MARKRDGLKHLDYKSQEYWNRLLVEEKLSVAQGCDPRLIYVGDSEDVENLEGFLQTNDGRRRIPQDENGED